MCENTVGPLDGPFSLLPAHPPVRAHCVQCDMSEAAGSFHWQAIAGSDTDCATERWAELPTKIGRT